MAKMSNILKLGRREGRFIRLAGALCPLATLLLPMPAQARNAADGYRFEQAEFLRADFRVAVVEYDSAEDVAIAAENAGAMIAARQVGNYGRSVSSKVLAWSRIREGVCEIHIIKATVEYRPDLLGHELAHCIYGRWHPSRP